MSKKKTALIVISAVFGLIVICCLFAYFIFGIKKVSYDTGEWNNLEKTFIYLPSVDEMGEYDDLKCKYLHKDYFIFQSDAYTLRAKYSEEMFDKQTNYIENNYVFQETVLENGEETAETTFKLDTFEFQMLSLSEYNLYFPKQIVFVGISEEENEIAFVFFDDFDLDYIDKSFSDFLIEECGWE